MGREEVYVSGSNWYLWKDMLELKIIPGIHILYNPLLYQLYTYSYIHICSKCPTPKQFLEPYLSKYNSDSLDYQCEQLSTPVLLGVSSLAIDVNQTQASHSMKPILRAIISICMFQQSQITLNTIIKADFLYQLMYWRFLSNKKLIDVITIP